MPLFYIYADTKNYRLPGFDREQSRAVFGSDIQNQFDVNFEAKSYATKWQKLKVNFDCDGAGMNGDLIPDISEINGRLFLTIKAYNALKQLLDNDGEFLPVSSAEHGDAWIFNPLSLAEDVDGLDQNLSIKNEWGDIENTAFCEDRVKDFMIFRSCFDNHRNAFCQAIVKEATESAGLKGVAFTPDLGKPNLR
ncbi:hypothetical protein [Teredinibacter turnerae]|uniref:hypothetical protein n=1 Tax=Teredinibacter turnerae TaxID=2426 RepID=UPI0030D2593B